MIYLILALGLILRLISINQSFWIDEATSASTVSMSLSNFFGKFMPGDFHPPLYYLALRVWALFFGTSEIALRSLSIVFATLTIYLVYLIGKEICNKKVGLIASLLLATSSLHIYYSQEARMYAMSTFLVSASIFLFTKILQDKNKPVWWILFSITLGFIGLTDYLPLLILIPIWIWAILLKKNLNWWKLFVMSHIVLLVFGVAWSPTFIKQLTSGINVTTNSPAWVNVLGKFSIKEILLIPVKFMIGRISILDKKIYFLVVGMTTLVFGFVITKSFKVSKNLKLVWLWLTIPLLVALVIGIKLPVLNYFRFLFLLPALYLLIACGINTLNKKIQMIFLILVIAINLITSLMYLTNIKFQREDWRSFSKFVGNGTVIFPANSQKEAYLYYNPNAQIIDVKDLNKKYKTIWLVRYAEAISDPRDTARLKVESLGYQKVNEYDFNGVVVWKYENR
jgi:mannosyltransferase